MAMVGDDDCCRCGNASFTSLFGFIAAEAMKNWNKKNEWMKRCDALRISDIRFSLWKWLNSFSGTVFISIKKNIYDYYYSFGNRMTWRIWYALFAASCSLLFQILFFPFRKLQNDLLELRHNSGNAVLIESLLLLWSTNGFL